MAKKEAAGSIWAIVVMMLGLFLLIFNSLDYLVGWHKVPNYVAAIGIVMLAIGVALTNRK
ncbi:MAG: hypothetical protein V1835_00300 [Candidatus Micrarchaeota archaeon]